MERTRGQTAATCATVFLREKTGCGLAIAGRMLPPGNFPSLDNVGRTLAKDWRSYTQTQIWVVVERGPSVTQGVINEFKLEPVTRRFQPLQRTPVGNCNSRRRNAADPVPSPGSSIRMPTSWADQRDGQSGSPNNPKT